MQQTTTNQTLVLLLLLLPLFGFFFHAFFGQRIIKSDPKSGKKWVGIIAVAVIVAAFACALRLAIDTASLAPSAREQMVTIAPWIDLGSLKLPFEFYVDPLSLTMSLIITGVGALIHLYSIGYMAEDKEIPRFFTYMNLFVFAMLVLVLAGNLVLLFVGWEGVGLCSYLLIGFWYKDHENVKAANKAFIVNRIGDVGFMLATFLLFAVIASGSKNVFAHGRFLSFDVLGITLMSTLTAHPGVAVTIGLLYFLAACGKSAQFPLYVWLPDAMAGPTPVSALIHAATMVTAGVFLVNRLHLVYQLAPVACAVVVMIGAFTALFAALIAFGQTDIKKVLAYSTISQLGYMFIACGAGGFSDGVFHLATHAFFKALLFLGAGAVIHAMAHNQDMRNYGNLKKYLPITTITMVIAFLAISGIPPFAGFYSKEAILGDAVGGSLANVSGIQFSQIAGYVGLFTAFLTALYMARLTWLTFFGKEERWRLIAPHHEEVLEAASAVILPISEDPNKWYLSAEETTARIEPDGQHAHGLDKNHTPKEVPISMAIPLIILAIASLIGGYLLKIADLNHWLYPTGLTGVPKFQEVSWLMPAGIAAGVLGILFGGWQYAKGLPEKEGFDLSKWSPIRVFMGKQFGYDILVSDGSSQSSKDIGIAATEWIDKGLIENGLSGLAKFFESLGDWHRILESGYARSYALLMFAGVIFILGTIVSMFHGGIH